MHAAAIARLELEADLRGAVERNELVASREFDRIKAGDWYVLRANYPELYAKSLREANLILERKRQRK